MPVAHLLQRSSSGIAEALVWELVASAVACSALRRTTDAPLLRFREGAKWLVLQTAVSDLCPDSQKALQRACQVFRYHCAAAMGAEGASSHAQAARKEVEMRAANDCLAIAPAAVRASAAWSSLVRRLYKSLVLAQLVPVTQGRAEATRASAGNLRAVLAALPGRHESRAGGDRR
jgi:hypothetical protein